MERKVGFIGAGNMGSAMIGGIIKAGFTDPQNVSVFDPKEDQVAFLGDQYGINKVDSVESLIQDSHLLVLAVKPNLYPTVLKQIKKHLRTTHIIITIAAGVSLRQVEEIIGKSYKIIRTMPNTPALVQQGMAALCPNEQMKEKDFQLVGELFNSFGKWEKVDEKLIDTVIAVSGSAPAYVFMFVEAMADAAVQGGMPRKQAYQFAAQTIMGAASMVMETEKHPGELKDMVCSPGGTTIEAVRSLEKSGFRSAIIEAMVDCMNKADDMNAQSSKHSSSTNG
ncbi:pyrroline-5-carboxylate reductase [Tindallia californiensis]|uniref:Pyrroline-5-carboxylate reductase n=1 Tax=Tindallia californiensis TaxID=159292 RepID=A0A1H3ML83_9FIRM|nr:pyrroline-5-carboxylate reductase [Tindallia californiensis]SDY77471.1 pyrroline-5-carboxylate reductase [Tindallia californiensis]